MTMASQASGTTVVFIDDMLQSVEYEFQFTITAGLQAVHCNTMSLFSEHIDALRACYSDPLRWRTRTSTAAGGDHHSPPEIIVLDMNIPEAGSFRLAEMATAMLFSNPERVGYMVATLLRQQSYLKSTPIVLLSEYPFDDEVKEWGKQQCQSGMATRLVNKEKQPMLTQRSSTEERFAEALNWARRWLRGRRADMLKALPTDLKVLRALASRWGLTEDEAEQIWPAALRPPGDLDQRALIATSAGIAVEVLNRRVSVVFAIHRAFRNAFGDNLGEAAERNWMRATQPALGGKSVLDLLVSGNVADYDAAERFANNLVKGGW